MHDADIVKLYWERSEEALVQTQAKYDAYLMKIAYNILYNREDSQESVSDTYLAAWNSIPPQQPSVLATYLGRIARQTSIDIFRRRTRQKRGGSEYALSRDELEDCVSGGDVTAGAVDLKLLGESIGAYLRTLEPEARNAFVGRYYFADSIREVAAYYGMTESQVKNLLRRTRAGLREHLKKEGFEL